MPARPRRCPRAVRGLLLILLCVLCLSAGQALAAEGAEAPPGSFQRADADAIRRQTREILDDPRYQPEKSFFQWLGEALSHWKGPDLPAGVGSFLGTVVVIWCLAALLAVLVHLVWTIVTMVRASRFGPRGAGLNGLLGAEASASYEDLQARMRELAAEGAFRPALGVMMVALLRWLDGAGIVKFHTSKTNGDYLRDYARTRAGAGYFRRFVIAFDAIAYGGVSCGARTYERMLDLFEEIRHDVGQESQV